MFFRKDEFRYDPDRDAYICPAGQLLRPIRHGRLRDLAKIDYGAPKACRDCLLRARCTNDVRSVSRLENEGVLDRMAERLKARPQILDRRREVVEHPFGSIKQWMYLGAFLMRGLENVRAEFSLTALVYNLRRALNVLGVGPMTAALRGEGRRRAPNPRRQSPQRRPQGRHRSGRTGRKPKRAVSHRSSAQSRQRKQFPHGLLWFLH